MRVVDLVKHPVTPILEFESKNAAAAELAAGQGEAHVHVVRMHAGGVVGTHEASFDQLFVILSGTGWLAGEGGRVELAAGQVCRVRRGEMHSKGAITDLVALVIQATELQ